MVRPLIVKRFCLLLTGYQGSIREIKNPMRKQFNQNRKKMFCDIEKVSVACMVNDKLKYVVFGVKRSVSTQTIILQIKIFREKNDLKGKIVKK